MPGPQVSNMESFAAIVNNWKLRFSIWFMDKGPHFWYDLVDVKI